MPGGLTTFGGLGVYIFFSISGYLITKSWLSDPHLLRYAIKRLLRIVPGLVVVVVLCAFVLGPAVSTLHIGEYFQNTGLKYYFLNILFHPVYALPGVFADNPHPHAVNGSLWTLPFEFFLYAFILIFLAVKISCIQKFLLLGCAAVIGIIGELMIFGASDPVVVYGSDIRYFFLFSPFFLVGSCFAIVKDDRFFDIRIACVLGLLAVFMSGWVLKIFAFFALPYCILTFGRISIPWLNQVGRFGDFSYGLYIYAFPMQQLTVQIFGVDAPQLFSFVISLAMTFVCAILSWHWIEKPMLSLKPRGVRRDVSYQLNQVSHLTRL